MKKDISLQFFEKVLIPVKQTLKHITLEVPKDLELDMEKGRVRLDTSLIQAGDQPTYSAPNHEPSSLRPRNTNISNLTQGVDVQSASRRNTSHQV